LAIDSGNLANLKEFANLLMRANDLTRARPVLERVVALQPDDLAPRQELAKTLEAAHDLEGAATQYRAILAALPNAHMSRALLAEVYMKQRQPDAALALLNEGIAVDPASPLMYREKGRVLDRTGRPADAVAAYAEYVRLAPGAADLRIFRDRIEQLSSPISPEQTQ
jgi:predicted Zn-dependent protease